MKTIRLLAIALSLTAAVAQAIPLMAVDPGPLVPPVFFADGVGIEYYANDGYLYGSGAVLNVNLGGGTVLDLQPYDAQLEFWANFVGVQDAGGLTTALFDTGGLTISADLGQGVEVMLAMAIGPADGTQGLSILAPTNSRSGVLAAVGVPTDGPDLDDGDLFYGGMVSIVFNVRGSSGSLVRINPALFSSDFTGEADCNVGLTTELIPEPSGLAMLGIGLSGLTAAMKRWI